MPASGQRLWGGVPVLQDCVWSQSLEETPDWKLLLLLGVFLFVGCVGTWILRTHVFDVITGDRSLEPPRHHTIFAWILIYPLALIELLVIPTVVLISVVVVARVIKVLGERFFPS